MKKKYQLNKYNQCVTLCTYVKKEVMDGVFTDIYIGSEYCKMCQYNSRVENSRFNMVYCNYKKGLIEHV